MSENATFLDSPTSSPEGGTGGQAAGLPSLQSLGAILRDRRESAGIPLSEVEHATRIRQKYLAAIEADEWHLLPGEVVGRGFLRNYAYYLNLDPNQMIDRRRAMADNSLSRTLAGTSTGVRLPPVRPVDYRPQDVDLEYTAFSTRMSEFFESVRDWLVPVVAAVLIVLVVLVIVWSFRTMGGEIGSALLSIQDRIASTIDGNRAGQNGQTDSSGGSGDAGGADESASGCRPGRYSGRPYFDRHAHPDPDRHQHAPAAADPDPSTHRCPLGYTYANTLANPHRGAGGGSSSSPAGAAAAGHRPGNLRRQPLGHLLSRQRSDRQRLGTDYGQGHARTV